MFIEKAGFSFRPITGFELEVNSSVYMYSDDGNLEICMIGGELENQTSLSELNDELAADFMINFDEFKLNEAGKDTVQEITGLVNEIRFINAEEEGLGKTLICSPHINQFFFMLVIASAEHWLNQGQAIFSAAKSQVHFHPKFKPTISTLEVDKHPDLTIETYDAILPEENLLVTIHRGDISLLLSARTSIIQDEIALTEIVAPGNQCLYRYNPDSSEFSSDFVEKPILSTFGELCVLLPFHNQQAFQIGNYRFAFATHSGNPLQEVQVIIRKGRALDLQKVDLNLWMALEDEFFYEPENLAKFEAKLRSELKVQLAPMMLAPGKIETSHPAHDELASFTCINPDTDLPDCSYMIAESVENGRALNIGLVDRFTRGVPPIDAETAAVSCGAPGMILSPVSPHACILVNYSAFTNEISALAKAIVEQLVVFCGLPPHPVPAEQPLALNPDLVWRLRQHPIFYNAD